MHPGATPAERTRSGREVASHHACCALWVAWYNFVTVNTAIRMRPAMASGLTDMIWTMRDLLK
jgi:hypothetical protein